MSADPQEQIHLDDGRRLSWSEYGWPGGRPLFYCHGFPACGLEAGLLHDAAAALGIRLIAPDRPGFGASDFRPGRTLLDWPEDLAALADHLDLERFALLGLSGGGPYALAAARRLGSRLNALALVGALGPLDRNELLDRMGGVARASFRLARRHSGLFRLFYGGLLIPLLRRRPTLGLSLLTVGAPEADRHILADDRIRSLLADSMQGAFRGGSAGALRELEIYAAPWGFAPREVACPVTLWHGLADATVPPIHGKWLEGSLPECRPRFLQGEGHFSLPLRHAERILRDLLERAGGG